MALNQEVTVTEHSHRSQTQALDFTNTSVIDLDRTGRLEQTHLNMIANTAHASPQREDSWRDKQEEEEEKPEELKLPEEMKP